MPRRWAHRSRPRASSVGWVLRVASCRTRGVSGTFAPRQLARWIRWRIVVGVVAYRAARSLIGPAGWSCSPAQSRIDRARFAECPKVRQISAVTTVGTVNPGTAVPVRAPLGPHWSAAYLSFMGGTPGRGRHRCNRKRRPAGRAGLRHQFPATGRWGAGRRCRAAGPVTTPTRSSRDGVGTPSARFVPVHPPVEARHGREVGTDPTDQLASDGPKRVGRTPRPGPRRAARRQTGGNSVVCGDRRLIPWGEHQTLGPRP